MFTIPIPQAELYTVGSSFRRVHTHDVVAKLLPSGCGWIASRCCAMSAFWPASVTADEPHDVRTALSILTQELLDRNCRVAGPSAADRPSGCDSSDCLVCQYKSEEAWQSTSQSSKLQSFLRKRSLPGSQYSARTSAELERGWFRVDQQQGSSDQVCPTTPYSLQLPPPGSADCTKRARVSVSQLFTTSTISQAQQAQATFAIRNPWRWQPEYAACTNPHPAQTLKLAALHDQLQRKCQSSQHGIVSALEFSPDGRLLAAGGISKQVQLYCVTDALDDLLDVTLRSPIATQRMPSKISSMSWSPHHDGVVSIADYDGIITQAHLASGHLLADIDAHKGKRIWSIVHSPHKPHLLASASDDHTVRLWGGHTLSEAVACVCPNPRASVCGVDFSSTDENLLALACSDNNIYLYDTRQPDTYLYCLQHHQRPVSYVKFFGDGRLVSASIDGSLALWPLHTRMCQHSSSGTTSAFGLSLCRHEHQQCLQHSVSSLQSVLSHEQTPARIFKGHNNRRNFVGLAVRAEDGLMSCGSETPHVYTYHESWDVPLVCHSISADAEQGTCSQPVQDGLFVSAVCWQSAAASQALGLPAVLAAADSQGTIHLLTLVDPTM